MKELPSGTVTFLFTDIEGSTRLWQQFPDAMESALSRHHALLASAIERHGGYLFQIVGDGCCAAFEGASDGVAAALDAQRALTGERWEVGGLNVRMALHTGAAEVRAGEFRSGEYVSGITLSRVSRILSAGHGGQVLLSQSTAERAQDQLPQGVALRDLGKFLLRDLVQPQQLFQLVAPGLRAEFPVVKALDAPRHNVPTPLTSFIGRESELEAIRGQLPHTRLLTLTGAGGSGKTRLSIQIALTVVDGFADGAWFAELAPVADPTFLPQAVAETFGLREEGTRAAEDILVDYLKDKCLLLVLDNCEHAIEAVARLAHRLIVQCPSVKLLATTREALGVSGEFVFPVPQLSMPDAAASVAAADVKAISQYESVRLFVDRAKAVQPAFTLQDQNAPSVAQICVRLDGIPLAIELAAARTKVLTPQQILARLNDRFRFLTGGSRTVMPRQQTLRAAIDWSFDLLSAQERMLFRRLCVFAGDCTLAAAETVASNDGIELADVLDLLTHLVNKSLVVAREAGDTVRYQLLESVRQYGMDKLVEAGELDALRDRHLNHYLGVVEAAEPLLYGAGQLAALGEIGAESDNVRAAMEWAASAPRTLPGLRLATRMGRYWTIRSEYVEGVLWLRRMMAAPDAIAYPVEHAWALYYVGFMAWFHGDKPTMQQALQQSFEMARSCGDRRCEAYALDFLGFLAMADRDYALADQCFEESQRILREADDLWGVALTLWHMGVSSHERHEPALHPWEQALEIFQTLGDSFRMGVLLRVIGLERLRTGDADGGLELLRQSLRIAMERRAKFEIANALWAFGEAAEKDMQAHPAQLLMLGALGVYDSIDSLHSVSNLLELGRVRRWLNRNKQQVDDAFANGRMPDIDEAIELAMALRPRPRQPASPA